MYDQSSHTFLNVTGYGVAHAADHPADDFRENSRDDYRTTVEQTAAFLAAEAGIDGSSTVLEVGDDCECLLVHLAQWFGCRGEGIFESEEYVRFAQDLCTNQRQRLDVGFRRASVLRLPYEPGSFSHVVSHGALHKAPDMPRSYAEIRRVLRSGGIFAFSDFYRPRTRISERTRTEVYEKFGWNDGYTLLEYHSALAEAGFEISSVVNVTGFLRRTFQGNAEAARARAGQMADAAARDKMLAFSASCEEVQAAIDRGEVGWAIVVVRKRDAPEGEIPPDE
ncbi:class I SAM-dependent methyltransferase [Nonomuraea sp. NPDC052116]|uniref:class I SAM-dependent methyltransferase n=1 Tax=Nonomuraea sp. NPDC052116 TaxID=3155665 RepID=UPI003436B2E4